MERREVEDEMRWGEEGRDGGEMVGNGKRRVEMGRGGLRWEEEGGDGERRMEMGREGW